MPRDTADTADTAAEDSGCPAVEGGGCLGEDERDLPPCPEGEGEGGEGEEEEPRVEGGGGCAAVPSGPALIGIVLTVVVLLRRARGLLPLVLLLLALPARAGVDAQAADPLDGGPFPLLREATIGPRWSAQGALWTSWITDAVVLVTEEGESPRLESAWTQGVGASLRFGTLIRAGLALPRHRGVRFAGSSQTRGLGDVSLWTQLPLRESPWRGPSMSWYTQIDLPTGLSELYLGDPRGAVKSHLSLGGPFGRFEGLANVGLRLTADEDLPGIQWGERIEYGLGVTMPVYGPTGLVAELQGSAGLPPRVDNRADFPLEALVCASTQLPRGLALTVGGGGGLTRGLGSPRTRLFLAVDARPRQLADADRDHIPDARDRCPEQPEDIDGFQDREGCPDQDNDQDGLLDVADACPDRAEVKNGYADEDGCPDQVVDLQLVVVSSEPGTLERARVQVGEAPPVDVLAEEPHTVSLLSGTVLVAVEADGHHPRAVPVEIGDGPTQTLTVRLDPVQIGRLVLRLEDPGGQALAGFARRAGAVAEVPTAGWTTSLPEGEHTLQVYAPGYRPREVIVEIPPRDELVAVVALEPSEARLTGRRVETSQEVRFELDSDQLQPEGLPALADVAALLLANPDIALLRIEGHADERADSRYNLDLSRRRAEAVRAWLVSRGVAPERLEAIGTGEARPREAEQAASRRVEFLVLVWDDEARE